MKEPKLGEMKLLLGAVPGLWALPPLPDSLV